MSLPIPEELLHQHIADLGKTGSGKSSVLRVIAENRLKKKKRLVIIDPKGDWWGLKSGADGVSPGYPVIMFGNFKEPRAVDVPINETSGQHVAELIAGGNRPCVIGLRGWMPSQIRKFWLDFAPTLFNKNEGELYVIIDEVHNLAPKGKILDVDSGKCLHWTNRLMSEGRGLGMTFFVASQRPQKVHNDTLDCCETLIAMRVVHPAAREAIAEWMKGNGDPQQAKQVLDTLAQLKRGEAWIWSPENEFGPKRVQFPMFETFDSFAPPQAQKAVDGAGWSTVDLAAVKEKLAAVIEEAKATDPKALQSRISELERDLAADDSDLEQIALAIGAAEVTRESIVARARELDSNADAVTMPQTDPAEIRRAVMERDQEWEKIIWNFRQTVEERFQEVAARINGGAKTISDALEAMTGNVILPSFEPPTAAMASSSDGGGFFVHPEVKEKIQAPKPTPKASNARLGPAIERARGNAGAEMLASGMRALRNTGEMLPEGETAVLNAIAQYGDLEKKRLTVLTGYKRSTRDAYIQRLANKGLVESSGTVVSITKAGMAALGSKFTPLPRGKGLQEFWRNRLPEGERVIFEYLIRLGGRDVRKDALDDPCGFARSTRDAYLQRMKARGVIEDARAGAVSLAAALLERVA